MNDEHKVMLLINGELHEHTLRGKISQPWPLYTSRLRPGPLSAEQERYRQKRRAHQRSLAWACARAWAVVLASAGLLLLVLWWAWLGQLVENL